MSEPALVPCIHCGHAPHDGMTCGWSHADAHEAAHDPCGCSGARDCRGCNFSGMDMDMDIFCVHPAVVKLHPYGLVLCSPKIASFCPSPALPLFEPRKERR